MQNISFHAPDGSNRATFVAERADTPALRESGLMNRTELATDRAMIFSFDHTAKQYFWMKDTFIPLDILFIREDGTVESIAADLQPCTKDPCPMASSNEPIRYVVEIFGGEAKKRGIVPGDTLVQ